MAELYPAEAAIWVLMQTNEKGRTILPWPFPSREIALNFRDNDKNLVAEGDWEAYLMKDTPWAKDEASFRNRMARIRRATGALNE